MKRTSILSLLIFWAGASALADTDTAYVSDKVYVDIRAGAHYESPVAHRLLAGTMLEVLEQSGDFTRVRDAQGRVGWIENRELTRELPAALRQAETERELATMRTELVKTQRDLQQAQKAMAEDTADEKAIAAAQAQLKRELAAADARLKENQSTLGRTQAALVAAQGELARTKAALLEETAKRKKLATEVTQRNAPAAPPTATTPAPVPAVAAVSAGEIPAPGQGLGSGDGPMPPPVENASRWQRMVAAVVRLDFLWLGVSFAMLLVGFGLGAVWLRERNRRKLGGMYLRI
jgi:SH3 domain protein